MNGVIYDANNPEGTQVLQSVNGCDSLVTVHLSFRPVINGGWDIDICQGDSIVINGHVYNEANPEGLEVFSYSDGCDSALLIVNLQFLPTYLDTLYESIAEGELFEFAGMQFEQSGVFQCI
ncbi:MAG: hypothetical protein IPL65_22440 [Lewinellaceae bacterium]|nr:hypothetical protein [Lewinellaceae bacterium]